MMAANGEGEHTGGSKKLCFVTIGATAGFRALIGAVLDLDFFRSLRDAGYTELRVQYGQEAKPTFDDFARAHRDSGSPPNEPQIKGVLLTGFDFKNDGLAGDMREAKGGIDAHTEGVVISHAGTGSILEAFRANCPLIVVPNTQLLDNHQQELAEELARQKYVVVGSIDNLIAAIREIEEQRQDRVPWLPVNHRGGLTPSQRFMAVLDEEMGFVD